MFIVGQDVMYGNVKGKIDELIGDNALVTLMDGKQYPIAFSQLATATSISKSYTSMDLKKMDFLDELAGDMNLAGITEIVIKNGKIAKFNAIESLEEKENKFVEEAITKAKEKAREEWEKEHKK